MTATAIRNLDLDTALAEARVRYAAAHPKSKAAFERAAAALPGGNTRTVLFYPPFPFVVERSAGARVWDLDGHKYVDFLGEYTAGLYGHSDPVIKAALIEAIERGIVHGGHTEAEARLAAALCARFPSLERVRFCNSGTEANMMALSTARAVTGRASIMVFPGGYHGAFLMFRDAVAPLNAPFPFVLGAYNDVERTKAVIEEHARGLAAVIVEPMMGSTGCIAADREFLAMLRQACSRHGIILIFDEVMTSRLAPGGLQEKHGVIPDMTTLGKYLGGGATFGAFGGRKDIMSRFDPTRPGAIAHAGTFNNNALSMSAGLAGITKVYTPERAVALSAAGDALRERLNAAARRHGLPVQLTGIGSMMSIHFRSGPIRNAADAGAGNQAAKALLHLDLLARGQQVASRGMINLSLPMTQAEFDGLVEAFDEFLSTHAGVIAAACR